MAGGRVPVLWSFQVHIIVSYCVSLEFELFRYGKKVEGEIVISWKVEDRVDGGAPPAL